MATGTNRIREELRGLMRAEDWWAVWLAFFLIALATSGFITAVPKIGKWTANPMDGLSGDALVGVGALLLGLCAVSVVGMRMMQRRLAPYIGGFVVVFVFSFLGHVLSRQGTIDRYGLEYVLWALLLGLLIANTVGTPQWLLAGARSELFIKTGLVLLGAEILFGKVVELGGRGLLVAWVVTPLMVIIMWWLGTHVLRMTSKALVIVIACAASVCGVSAAIAAATAARAKKEELTLAVGMSLIFTVGMMVAMPAAWLAFGGVLFPAPN